MSRRTPIVAVVDDATRAWLEQNATPLLEAAVGPTQLEEIRAIAQRNGWTDQSIIAGQMLREGVMLARGAKL